jgi:flagellar biosynthesis protein FlhG
MNRVISFSSGKGGVGKTSLVVNLGTLWARQGKKVLLIDGDWSLGKLAIMLGVKPTSTIEKVLSGDIPLKDSIQKVSENLSLIASPSGLVGFEELSEVMRNQLFFEFEELEDQYDLILLDHSSGIHWGVLQFAAASHQHLIVTTPEPTSYTDAYAIMKILSKRFSIRDFSLVVTMSQDLRESEKIISRFMEVVRSQLGVRLNLLDVLPWEQKMNEAVCKQRPIVDLHPNQDFSLRLERLSERVERLESAQSHGLNFFYKEQTNANVAKEI